MFKKFFSGLFNKDEQEKPQAMGNYLVATLNDRILPIDRGAVYEDPLEEFLKLKWYGEISGGGTLQSKSGEIEYCDIEICIKDDHLDRIMISDIINKLEDLGAPKGSSLLIERTQEKIPFGLQEGLAIYLDGVNLSEKVYKNSDAEAIAEEVCKLANIDTKVLRYWEGTTETALYFYGRSFEDMKQAISRFLSSNPECENARIVQIA